MLFYAIWAFIRLDWAVTVYHCSFPISLFFICVYLKCSRGKRRDPNWFIVGLEVDQLYSTLWDPKDCSLPGTSVHGIFQAWILQWIAIPFSRGSPQPRDRTQVSCIAGRFFTIWATRDVSTHQSLILILSKNLKISGNISITNFQISRISTLQPQIYPVQNSGAPSSWQTPLPGDTERTSRLKTAWALVLDSGLGLLRTPPVLLPPCSPRPRKKSLSQQSPTFQH